MTRIRYSHLNVGAFYYIIDNFSCSSAVTFQKIWTSPPHFDPQEHYFQTGMSGHVFNFLWEVSIASATQPLCPYYVPTYFYLQLKVKINSRFGAQSFTYCIGPNTTALSIITAPRVNLNATAPKLLNLNNTTASWLKQHK